MMASETLVDLEQRPVMWSWRKAAVSEGQSRHASLASTFVLSLSSVTFVSH
jgi:hypothetical protein